MLPVTSAIAVMNRLPNEWPAMPSPCALVEAVLEEVGHQRLRVGEGGDAVADVAGRDHVQVAAQPAAGAAVIGDGDDGGEVGRVLLEPAQQVGEAGAATDRHDASGRARACGSGRRGR
jgi:hypothetical protein